MLCYGIDSQTTKQGINTVQHVKGLQFKVMYKMGCGCGLNAQSSIASDCGYKRSSTNSEAPHLYTQPERIGYLVPLMGGQIFENF